MTDNDITKGVLERKRPLVINTIQNRWNTIATTRQNLIQTKVLNYAKSMSKETGLPLNTVLQSKPVQKYRDKIWLKK